MDITKFFDQKKRELGCQSVGGEDLRDNAKKTQKH